MTARIYPSLIGADPLNLAHVIRDLDPHCYGYHLDVMDAHFVPNLTMGPSVINAIAKITTRELWVHLMVDDPLLILDQCEMPAASLVSFHIESNTDHKKIIKAIQERKWRAGIAMNPKTPVATISPLLDRMIDHILIMSVEPGFSGQKFIPQVREKIALLMQQRNQRDCTYTIGIDGGVQASMLPSLLQDGVTLFAIASGIFNTPDPLVTLQKLNQLLEGA